ncbi:MAG: cation diffusion facilitator family transporter [Turicibacter sp.]
MCSVNQKNLREQKVLKLLVIVSFAFVMLELVMSVFTKSQALLIDAVFDTSEFIMTWIAFKLLPLIHKPVSEKKPYGYLQVETLLVIIKGFMMLIVTLGIFVNSIQIIFDGGSLIEYDLIAIFNLFSTVISLAVFVMLYKSNQGIHSPLLTLEMKGWMLDALISFGLGIAFLIPLLIKHPVIEQLTPYLDPIVSIILGLFMLPLPLKTIVTGFKDIFLFAPEDEIMDYIKQTSDIILTEHGMINIVYDVWRTGRKIWVCIYFTPVEDTISVAHISMIQEELRNALHPDIPDVSLELLPSIE